MPATGTLPSIALLRQAVTVAVAGMARSYERWSTPARVVPPIASGARLAIPPDCRRIDFAPQVECHVPESLRARRT